MKFLISTLVATMLATGASAGSSRSDKTFQYDYCSWVHSQHVIDRINSEVKPLFQTYGLQWVKDGHQCPIAKYGDHFVPEFVKKRQVKQNHECSICKKQFGSEDDVEFHMKQAHYRGDKITEQYQRSGVICPAEYCDIFECPELSDKTLRLQVYKERTDGNYEGRVDLRENSKRKRNQPKTKTPPLRYELMTHYHSDRKATLLQRCHRTFLDCVDYKNSEADLDGVMRAFDFFSQMYCQKFEEGQVDNREAEEHDRHRNLGVYKMVSDIREEDYSTPLATLKQYKPKESPDKKAREVNDVLWWVFFVISVVLTLIYCIGLYFTYFDDPKEFQKTFNNDKRMQYGGLSRQDISEAQQINRSIKEKFTAPTESAAFKEAKKRKVKHVD